ncbi:MAG: chorismate synthase [Acidobacteriota bacterium]|nr:chorismate synthase [Acidobacteriota bacterium]
MNSFGRMFRIHIYGESHGHAVGVVIDGCPPGLAFAPADCRVDLGRRAPGRPGTTARREPDIPEIQSGIFQGRTTGTPIAVRIENANVRSADYDDLRDIPRPGHADFAARVKSRGFNDPRGGGMFSGRLTAGLVVAGVLAKKIIAPLSVAARLSEAGGRRDVEAEAARAAAENDSCGGIVECRAEGVPAGLGEPFFDSLESLLGHMIFSIPGVKGLEFGAGFAAARMRGSAFNDTPIDARGATATNHAGGVAGGITTGNLLEFRAAIRPAASIGRPQKAWNIRTGKPCVLRVTGRHDACFALRVPAVIEAATAIVLADLLLLNAARNGRADSPAPPRRQP